jgi:MerR family transcriptional regulator, redox-sensitive transcriptional activator SoxR
MPQFTISQVARRIGMQSSAIRYYEKIGVLLPGQRFSGRRRYDVTVFYRLAVIQRARQSGFTLDEIRQLFFGFRSGTRASKRWQKLSRKKLNELDKFMAGIASMRSLLKQMMQVCHCTTLDQCGRGIFQREYVDLPGKALSSHNNH